MTYSGRVTHVHVCCRPPVYVSGPLITFLHLLILDSAAITISTSSQHNSHRFLLRVYHVFSVTCHQFHWSQHQPAYFGFAPSPLSGIKVLVIGVIIPLYADSLSLNPLRSTLCHAWLTCLRWCQVLAVSRRLPYATVLLSPLMSVKRTSGWKHSMPRCTLRNPVTVTRMDLYCTHKEICYKANKQTKNPSSFLGEMTE